MSRTDKQRIAFVLPRKTASVQRAQLEEIAEASGRSLSGLVRYWTLERLAVETAEPEAGE